MYWSRTGDPLDVLALLIYLAACMAGGWFLVRAGFRLPTNGRAVVGAALGLSLATWLANVVSRWMLPPTSFWLSALIVLAAGLGLLWRSGDRMARLGEDLRPWLLGAAMVGAAFVFFRLGSGLAIFDDRKNLSLISLMAAGEIPPHFYMNPDFLFAYHYAFQLFGAMVMRIGNMFPWSAFDLAKGIAGALAVGLSVVWGWRASGKWAWGIWTGGVVLFASGARWLLLLLPAQLVSAASHNLTLWGSAAQTGPTFGAALRSPWVIEGGPPFPLPFAFVNGILQPFVLYLQTGPASMGLVALLLLLLLYPARARPWTWVIFVVLLAFWALAAETGFVLFLMGSVLACAVLLMRQRRPSARRPIVVVLGCLVLAALLALLQGGTLTEFFRSAVSSGFQDFAAGASDLGGFSLRAAPAIVSSHLGELRLDEPGELLIGLFEIGPALLLAPLAAWILVRSARRGRWMPLALTISTFIGFLFPLVLRFDVDRDITRLTQYALIGWILLAVAPLALTWARGGVALRGAIAVTTVALVFAGVVVTGPLLTAFPKPVTSEGFLPADTAMTRLIWDRLERGALIVDSGSWRAVAVTGRLTRSAQDSSTLLASWESLVEEPEVSRLVEAGFDYAYVDRLWWDEMSDEARRSFQEDCVREVAVVHDNGANGDRWLYDLRSCTPE